MLIDIKRIKNGKLPLLPLFLAGVVLGVMIMNLGKGMLLENTGLLDEYTLYHMKYMTVSGNVLFWYILGQRLKEAVFLTVMAVTGLGLAAVCGMCGWYGMAVGMFLSASVLRYGIKGILLALTGLFPQYLLYIPAVVLLLVSCEKMCRRLHFRGSGNMTGGPGRRNLSGLWLRFPAAILLMVLGCILEAYVNPHFLFILLKRF